MNERLKCDRCGVVYTDSGSIESAKKWKEKWEQRVRADGDIPRGISPCPILPCSGELILEKVQIYNWEKEHHLHHLRVK